MWINFKPNWQFQDMCWLILQGKYMKFVNLNIIWQQMYTEIAIFLFWPYL